MTELREIFSVAADAREQGHPYEHLLAEVRTVAPWFDACALGRPDPAARLLLTDGPEHGYHAILRGLLQQWRKMTGTEPDNNMIAMYEGTSRHIAQQFQQLRDVADDMWPDTARGRALDQLIELSRRGQRR